MDNTKIDWADMTWNPVTGCRHGCEYCYAARTAGRFAGHISNGVKVPFCTQEGPTVLDKPLKTMTEAGNVVNAPYPFGFTPTFHRYRLGDPARKQRPRNIFVCSMADLFGAWVPTKWIMEVLDACLAAPQHNYLFLTNQGAGPGAAEDGGTEQEKGTGAAGVGGEQGKVPQCSDR